MRKSYVAIGVAILMAIPLTALAAKPEVVVDDTFEFGPEPQPVLSELCGYEIMTEGTESVRVTEFFDQNGDFSKAKINVHGNARYWSEHDYATETFALSITVGADGSRVIAGSVWNVHSSSGDLLIQDAGRVVFDSMGEIVTVNGPHEELFAEFGIDDSGIQDFCMELAS